MRLNSNHFSPGFIDPESHGLGKIQSHMVGIKNIYVGSRQDTLLCFTFYTGISKEFVRPYDGRYIEFESVSGLFNISINYSFYKERYLRYILDTVGYKKKCVAPYTNCFEKNDDGLAGFPGGTIYTNDRSVKVKIGRGDLMSIYLLSNTYTLRRAIRNNMLFYINENEKKMSMLD